MTRINKIRPDFKGRNLVSLIRQAGQQGQAKGCFSAAAAGRTNDKSFYNNPPDGKRLILSIYLYHFLTVYCNGPIFLMCGIRTGSGTPW
jgi:hypothetical protein